MYILTALKLVYFLQKMFTVYCQYYFLERVQKIVLCNKNPLL